MVLLVLKRMRYEELVPHVYDTSNNEAFVRAMFCTLIHMYCIYVISLYRRTM